MSTEIKNENPLGYKSIGKLISGFAIPSIIAMVISSLYNVVDQIFIGQKIGYLGNAATNVAFPLTTICMAITLCIGIGTAARYSLYLGRKEEDKAAKVVGNSVCMMFLFGILYAIVAEIFLTKLLVWFGATDSIMPYAIEYTRIVILGMPLIVVMNGMSNIARADGSPMYSMTSMIIGAVINTILDPIFLFVFEWGVAGAAWATVIGQIASCIYALLYLKKIRRCEVKREYFKLSLSQMGSTAVMGMSNGLTQLAITAVQIVMNNSLVYYGAQSIYGSDIPLAAAGIVMKVNGIVLSVIIGLVQGMQPIIGFNYGAQKYDRVRAAYFLCIKVELVVTLIAVFFFEYCPQYVLSIFGDSEGGLYIEFACMFMRIFLILLPLGGVQMISSNLFSAIGKPLLGTLLSLSRQVFFFIPLVLILGKLLGLNGIMYAAPGSDVLAFIVVMVFIVIEFRKMRELEQA